MKKLLLLPVVLVSCLLHGQTNYALNLNGTSQYASIGAVIPAGSSYTKEAWVYVTINSGARNIISSQNHPFWINGGVLQAGQAGNYTRVVDVSAFPLNTWVHTAVTFDAATSTMLLYRNGVLVSTATGVPAYTSENMVIGSHTGTGSFLQGQVDEVRIWNYARTAAQIKANMFKGPGNNETGLLAYYPANEGSGTTLINTTGGTNGTLTGGPTWVQSPVGFNKNALSFDGTNDVVTIPDHSSLDIASAITLEGWVYATKTTGIQNVMSKSANGSGNIGYIFPRTDDGWNNAVVYLHIAGGWRTLSAPYPGRNAWHHLAATYDGTTIRLYINGAEVASKPQTGTITLNNNSLTLGNQTGYNEFFGGTADELRIWNVARTQAEIQDGMNKELNPSLYPNLIAYYNMNQGITSGANSGLTNLIDQAGSNNGVLQNFALSGTTSNFVVQNGTIITLPLEWLSFSAIQTGNDVLLKWSTAREINVKDFIVQHSTDGRTWKAIGSVNSNQSGISELVNNYEFVHAGPDRGLHYYRIMQSDLDGRFSYSEVRSVKITGGTEGLLVLNNPVQNGVLKLRLASKTNFQLFDVRGVLIWQGQGRPGVNEISVGRFAKGVYWLKAGSSAERIILK